MNDERIVRLVGDVSRAIDALREDVERIMREAYVEDERATVAFRTWLRAGRRQLAATADHFEYAHTLLPRSEGAQANAAAEPGSSANSAPLSGEETEAPSEQTAEQVMEREG